MSKKLELLKLADADYRPHLVAIDSAAIAGLSLPSGTAALATVDLPFNAEPWTGHTFPAPDSARAVIQYLLAMTALQYRFWSIDNVSGQFNRYEFDGKVGSTGLATAFGRAWGREPEMSSALRTACTDGDALAVLFGADIPGAISRREILHEVLVSPAGEHAVNEIEQYLVMYGRVDVDLAAIVAGILPNSYGDEYLKKAMLFLAFLGGYLQSNRTSKVVVDLCAYADYQVPSVLRHHGILKYSPEVADAVDGRKLLASGGTMERAIRSATILACERMAIAHTSTAAGVDWWCFQQRKLPTKPFHLTMTTDY